MKKNILVLMFISLWLAQPVFAKSRFIGNNYSGEYLCKGKNDAVGEYEVLVTLKLNKLNSYDYLGVYDFTTETVNEETYYGQAVAHGRKVALTFKLKSAVDSEYSTGFGKFKKLGRGLWEFSNLYYEPGNKAGGLGSEVCRPHKTKKSSAK